MALEMLTFEMEPFQEVDTVKRQGWSETGPEVKTNKLIMNSTMIHVLQQKQATGRDKTTQTLQCLTEVNN